ncbi:type IV secretion system protein VirB3 [Parashewanella spongiae]|uniref:Type IV secretion system protein VirB3 n=1 Tax=Parashewanella spongiae TaxID=342950 RepID=A0A3A6TP10_9GAMM|nr:VirB3 family type IV secretion system protein [Parashewanella spongiae]MCL1077103.1 VirB3 family type IV secretion system protein [Parashewanella spongiae]RJY17664.1 type IV secretion system protein VirB3 [Parashewanella spongiae]
MNEHDPLFVAVTRPAMKWGVTLDGIIITGALVAVLMIITKNPLILLLYLPVHGVLYVLCLRDPRLFRLTLLWLKTKAKSIAWRLFSAASACPYRNTRSRSSMLRNIL